MGIEQMNNSITLLYLVEVLDWIQSHISYQPTRKKFNEINYGENQSKS